MQYRVFVAVLLIFAADRCVCLADEKVQSALDQFYVALLDDPKADPVEAAKALIAIGETTESTVIQARGWVRLGFAKARPHSESSGWRDDLAKGIKLAGTESSVQRAEALMFGGYTKARVDNDFAAAHADLKEAIEIAREFEQDRVIAMAYVMSSELHRVGPDVTGNTKALAREHALRGRCFATMSGFGPLQRVALRRIILAMKSSRLYAAAVPYAKQVLEHGDVASAKEVLYLAGERPQYPDELKEQIESLRADAPEDLSARTPLPRLQLTYGTFFWREYPEETREYIDEAAKRLDGQKDTKRAGMARVVRAMVPDEGLSDEQVVAAFHAELGATPEARFKNATTTFDSLDVANFYEKYEEWQLAADWRTRELAWLREEVAVNDANGVHAAQVFFDEEMERRRLKADVSTARSEIAAQRAGLEEERIQFSRKAKFLWGIAAIGLGGAFLTRFLLVLRHRKQLVAEVRRQTESLENATAEAEQSREQAQRADQAKSEFLACINHELRTPLNAILGACQLLRRENECGSREFDIIHSSSEHLLQLVNNVLDVSSIEHGETILDERVFDMRALGQSVSNIVEHAADKKRIPFHCEIDKSLPQLVFGDQGKLRQVLINLCSNAIKFTDSGRVHLRLSSDDDSIGASFLLVATVSDTGAGIPADQLQRMFEPFSQSEDARRKRSGTGLGLYICRTFAEGMGGSITVESRPGLGSEFCLKVPLTSRQDNLSDSGIMGPVTVHDDAPVLVVDDNQLNLEIITGLLNAMGYVAHSASNKQQAMLLMERHRPRSVLMDLHMPGTDGFEILAAMRATEAGEKAMIAALTGDAIEAVRKRALEAGFDAFLAKPVRLKQLELVLTGSVPVS